MIKCEAILAFVNYHNKFSSYSNKHIVEIIDELIKLYNDNESQHLIDGNLLLNKYIVVGLVLLQGKDGFYNEKIPEFLLETIDTFDFIEDANNYGSFIKILLCALSCVHSNRKFYSQIENVVIKILYSKSQMKL